MEYMTAMQSLITKTAIEIIIILSLIAIVLGLIWTAMLFYYKKNKKKRKSGVRSSFIGSVTLTAICLLFSLVTISSFRDIKNMKQDIAEQSFVTYVGEYEIHNDTFRFSVSITELWFDLRAVTIENEEEPLWFDRMSDFDVDSVGRGKVIYGKNSRYVVRIEEEK